MENKDFVTEQILSLEDFDNVDSALMEKISSNEEYRKLFEECRELSELIAHSAPEPVKDGVTLHDAVMKRIKDGDVAPRYINNGRSRLPIATAASIAVIVSAAIMIGTGTFEKEMADNAAQRFEVTDAESIGVAETEGINTKFSVFQAAPETGSNEKAVLYSKKADGSFVNGGIAPASIDDGVMQDVYSYSNGVEDVADGEEEAPYSVVERQSTDINLDNLPIEYWTKDDFDMRINDLYTGDPTTAKNDVKLEKESGGSAKNETIEEAVTEEAASAAGKYAAEEEKAVSSDTVMDTVTEAPEAEAEAVAEEAETSEESLDLDVVGRMVYASKLVPTERLITYKQISELGTDNYIAWFDSIRSREDFADIYSIESFAEFCESRQAK